MIIKVTYNMTMHPDNVINTPESETASKVPLVSIILRTKNRIELLKSALNSLLSQDHPAIQVVVINDGGTDIKDILLNYHSDRLKIDYFFNQDSKGRAAALNMGIENAKGEWIGILDDDDIYLPDAISSLLKFAQYKNADAVYGKVEMLDYRDSENPNHIHFFNTLYDEQRLIFDNYIPVNAILVKRGLLLKVGAIDMDFKIFEDWDYIYRISQVSKFCYLDYLVAEYRSYGDATATGGKTLQLHQKYRTLFYQKHIKTFTPEMFSLFYQLVLQSNQEKYLSSIDRLLRFTQTLNQRNDHNLTYTKQVNKNFLEQANNINKNFSEQIDKTNKNFFEQIDKTNKNFFEQINPINKSINSIQATITQNTATLQSELKEIKLRLDNTFTAKVKRFMKKHYNHFFNSK